MLLTVLTLAPSLLMMVTSFIRIIDRAVLRPQRDRLPADAAEPGPARPGAVPDPLRDGPDLDRINDDALQPYLHGDLAPDGAFDTAQQPLREFMFKQTREKDLALFVQVGGLPQPHTPDDVPTYVVIPAFMISELKTAFQMGFMILLPFLVIDIVVSSILMSMGMMMLPPARSRCPSSCCCS